MITVDGLKFNYPRSSFLLDLDKLEIAEGEKVAIIGPSGCGKTTLVYLIAGIYTPGAGRIMIDGFCVSDKTDQLRRDYRISNIGFIFQEFELINYLHVKENILLPFFINRSLEPDEDISQTISELADSMGLGDKLRRYPSALSQGEKQRVAICRALITKPKMIIADEPTGSLDAVNKSLIMDIIHRQTTQRKTTLIMVTHDHSLLNGFDRTVDLGQLFKGN